MMRSIYFINNIMDAIKLEAIPKKHRLENLLLT